MENKDTHKTSLPGLPDMFRGWYLDYASYVILNRAVPEIIDGLKPVQRRILHSMKELDDGRYNKVANIIGNTMKYHPHGDQSIGGALVQLGQKDLLIDCQGNWGNILTGDSAAAPRYIEARLSKFANDVVFNPKTTDWTNSYDGRNKEPIALPAKFPLLLNMGTEGIAVGLATKILPHNFNELIDASIAILKNQDFELYPDFPTGGFIDVKNYNDGIRGGKVRIRAKINIIDNKTVAITEIPFSTTTSSLIEDIVKAKEQGKIKIKKIDDNTAEKVEIVLHLENNVSPDATVDALYALKICEITISPNSCVIVENHPQFLGMHELLIYSTNNTVALLKKELEIKMSELLEDWHFSSLEKIFFEERIYRHLEDDVPTWDDLMTDIERAFDPFRHLFKREIMRDDVVKLTDKPVRKISKFDVKKADEHIKGVEDLMKEIQNNLDNLIEYALAYFRRIKKTYGDQYPRLSEIRNFENIDAKAVVAANVKLYVNREEGFVGTALKKDEFVCDCSDLDDIIVFLEDGSFKVSKVAEKVFFGKDIIFVCVFNKNDDRTIYNVVYQDGKVGNSYVKRFNIGGITRDKDYNITKGTPNSKILYFTSNPNGEAEHIRVFLKNKPGLRRLQYDFDFASIAIKGRSSMGNIIAKNPIKKIVLENVGLSTLSARKIWFDDSVKRLNTDERGLYLGEFSGDDKLLAITQSGIYRLTNFDLNNRYDEDQIFIEKYNPKKIITAVFYDGEQKFVYIKRFKTDEFDKKISFIGEHKDSKLLTYTIDFLPQLEVVFEKKNGKDIPTEIIDTAEFIGEKSAKARGKRLSTNKIKKLTWLEPLPYEEEVEIEEEAIASEDEVPFEIIRRDDDDLDDGEVIQGELF